MSSLVYLKNKKNNVTYVYENTSKWDTISKKCICSRKCIGQLHALTGEVIPNKSKIKNESVESKNTHASVIAIGQTLLFDKISSHIGLDDVLKHAFPEDWNQILSCAYFILSEGKALCHCEKWSASHKTPYGNTLTSQRISELLARITKNNQMEFFRKWIQLRAEQEYFALDITSVSSYSKQNEYVRYGYNRDGESLPQINMCMLLGEKSHLPIYYEILPGSIHDVSTLKNILKMLEWINAKKIHLVMDKGFCSEGNIDELYKSKIHFTVGMSFVSGFTKECVKHAKENDIMAYQNFYRVRGNDIFTYSWLHDWKGHRLYVHVYYDSEKADGQYRSFLRTLDKCRQELESKTDNKKHEYLYKKYFTIKETPIRGRKVTVIQEAIDEYRNTTAGYFVLTSNDIKDPVKALTVYREKDVVEKGFDNLKNSLDSKRLRVHSEENMQGRQFIQYIALIIAAKMQVVMNQHDMYKNTTMSELINEMKTLQEVQMINKGGRIYTTLTKEQLKIMKIFGIDSSTYV